MKLLNKYPLQAITTKYLPPTNHRGSRIKATAQAGSLTVGWDDALGPAENHHAAAEALARRYGWETSGWASGVGAYGLLVFVRVPTEDC